MKAQEFHANLNNASAMVLGPNPYRYSLTFTLVGSVNARVSFLNPTPSNSSAALVVNSGQVPFTLTRDQIGELITQPVYVTMGSGGADLWIIEAFQ